MFTRNPFQMALGLTALAFIFIVPALFGCDLHKSNQTFVGCAPWSDTVLWNRVAVGVPVALVAAYTWRRAIRSIS
jgi:hypothetical protein